MKGGGRKEENVVAPKWPDSLQAGRKMSDFTHKPAMTAIADGQMDV